MRTATRGSRCSGISRRIRSRLATGLGGLGALYDAARIDEAIAGKRPIRIGNSDLGDLGHGTSVAGVAAGNGSPASCSCCECCRGGGVFAGIAPEANIIAVRITDVKDVRLCSTGSAWSRAWPTCRWS
ncbi:MAG: S8 family serine peptidase [Deltaproteobacteria bacterium]|nr:S8 family serine peptidase [Deltaproteobacteria bacterium]